MSMASTLSIEQGRAGNFVEVYEVKSSSEEEEEGEENEVVELLVDRIENDDVVGKVLPKCAKISAELNRELHGTSSSFVVTG